jgi:hypothetical protein
MHPRVLRVTDPNSGNESAASGVDLSNPSNAEVENK